MKNLVLIPHWGGDAAVWARTLAALDGVAAQVGNTLEDDTLAGMARRILADAPPTFCLAGVSMGGMVALEIIRLAPERVRGLALVDTSAHRPRPVSEAGAARFHKTNAAALAGLDMRAFARSSIIGLVHPNAPQDVRDDLVEMMVRVGAATYARQYLAVAEREDQRLILPTIKVPTQVIVGAEDRMTPTRTSAQIHRAVAGSEFHIIAECGHLPPHRGPATYGPPSRRAPGPDGLAEAPAGAASGRPPGRRISARGRPPRGALRRTGCLPRRPRCRGRARRISGIDRDGGLLAGLDELAAGFLGDLDAERRVGGDDLGELHGSARPAGRPATPPGPCRCGGPRRRRTRRTAAGGTWRRPSRRGRCSGSERRPAARCRAWPPSGKSARPRPRPRCRRRASSRCRR